MGGVSLTLAAAQIGTRPGDLPFNLDQHLHFCDVAADHGANLIVFPELSLIGYELDLATGCVVDPMDELVQPLRRMAAEFGLTIVAGAPLRGRAGALHIGSLHIGSMTFRPEGSVITYFKEYVHSSEEHVFTSGAGGAVIDLDGTSVALAICRDATFAEHAKRAADAGATVYAASVMIDEAGYQRKSELLRRWAVEHGMAVLMANYAGTTGGETSAGKSMIWAEGGEVVAGASDNQECLVIASRDVRHWTGRVVPVSKE